MNIHNSLRVGVLLVEGVIYDRPVTVVLVTFTYFIVTKLFLVVLGLCSFS